MEVQPLAVELPLRILVMMANPRDHARLDVEQEWSSLRDELAELAQRGVVELERLEEPTLEALQKRLRQGKYHIFHFIGHGAFDRDLQTGALILEKEEAPHAVFARQIGVYLHDHRTLRLVVLNACVGAQASPADLFAGVAQSLVQRGIPAVIAMQFEIADETGITFAKAFYGALADGDPVEAAVAEARKALSATSDETAWAAPVLFTRARDGYLFDMQPLSMEKQKRNRIAALLHEAKTAMPAEDWPKVEKKLRALLSLENNREATVLLAQVERRQELPGLFSAGRGHYEAGRWREALACFQQVLEIAGNYENVFRLIAAAIREIEETEAVRSRPAPSPPVARAKPEDHGAHYEEVVRAFLDGRVIPCFDAAVNLCGRPPGSQWQDDQYLPGREELSVYLAQRYGYPANEKQELARVAQYVEFHAGRGPLFADLHELFARDFRLTMLHQFFATLPVTLQKKGYAKRYPFIITTNYDG
jgi:tetratricopeptide (TPR) repeat protein